MIGIGRSWICSSGREKVTVDPFRFHWIHFPVFAVPQCAHMAPIDTAPVETHEPETGTDSDVGERARHDVEELVQTSKASTVKGISADVQQRVQTDLLGKKNAKPASGKSQPADPYEEEVESYAHGFDKAIEAAKIGDYGTDNTDPSIRAYTKLSGEEGDITFNNPALVDLVAGGKKAVDEADLTRIHEQQHIHDPGLTGTVYVNKAVSLKKFDRTEGKAETMSHKLKYGSEKIERPNAPKNYLDAQRRFVGLQEATKGDAKGEELLDGVMNKEAPRRSIGELNGYLWEKALKDGTTDVETVERQAKEGGYDVEAQQVITKHQLRQIPELRSALDRLEPSMN